ncbi:hypothetical protein HBB16_00860 [Pseudonocardia sp. MCCB 268]|nr:hypothetical protein [Pseudonocardia cytotoxica]
MQVSVTMGFADSVRGRPVLPRARRAATGRPGLDAAAFHPVRCAVPWLVLAARAGDPRDRPTNTVGDAVRDSWAARTGGWCEHAGGAGPHRRGRDRERADRRGRPGGAVGGGGETLGLVGESGSGKTLTSLAIR